VRLRRYPTCRFFSSGCIARRRIGLSLRLSPASRRVSDIACGTEILANRISKELHPDEVYGVDMSDGIPGQARARSSEV
jgi:ubiquinone/menaquinone biosynthesis C-methylase UbiE